MDGIVRGDCCSVEGRCAIDALLTRVVCAGVHDAVARYQVQRIFGADRLAVDFYREILLASGDQQQAEK
jgi:hypothetical protein